MNQTKPILQAMPRLCYPLVIIIASLMTPLWALGQSNCSDSTACNYADTTAMMCLYFDECNVCGGDGIEPVFMLDEVYAYDEADSGDVSSNAAMPMQLPWMGAGSYRLSGNAVNFQNVNSDPEYFTLDIPAGFELTGIQLLEYDQSAFAEANDTIVLPFGNGGFMGVGPGDSLPVINTQEDFVAAAMALDGGALIGVHPGSQPGDELMDNLGMPFAFPGVSINGIPSSLGEGSWTFMFKEGNTMSGTEDAGTDWSFSLQVSAVGENSYVSAYDCNGDCLNDTNENGQCDEFEVQGCMDPIALNYNADATLSDVCEYVPANCIPQFDPAIQDTVAVACVDDLPLEAPEQYAYDPCTPGSPALDILSSMLAIDTLTPCGQFVTYRYLALNLTYGLIAVQEQTWMVMDTVGPMISSVPEDLVIACTDDSTAYGMIEAADACHDVFSIEYTIDSLYVDTLSMPVCPGNYLIARTVTAMDVCGNANAASYVITVRDTVGPALGNIPMNDTLSCEMPIPTELPIHQDACSGSELSVTTAEQPGLCPENYTLIRTFVAQDQCGNSSAAIQEVTFIDTLAPAILTTPDDLLLSCEEMVPDSAITAGDDCSTIEISSLDSIVSGACPQEYTILRTHTALDACGNGATHVQSIAVVDTVAPAFSMLEAFVTATCGEADEVLAAAEDTCSAVTVAFSTFNAAGSAGMPGQQVRLYTASDECGNAAEGIQLVTFSNAEACAGCMNETAMNYDPTAVIDDGSCDFGGIYNEAGECILDEDEDGVCDQLEIAGCQDPMACNYVSIATEAGDCVYPDDPTRDCTGVCLNDGDGDGICDENEVVGCQDINACNFDLFATDSDPALCDYSCQGCTYSEATNYDAGSTVDDGSCEFDLEEVVVTTCDGDADGDGQVGILDLLDVLDSFGTYCD